jgi:hypothetical protein
VSQYAPGSITYVPVPTRVEAVSVAERIAREHGARLVSGWGPAAEALDHDDPGAELAAISWAGRRAALLGSTSARALVAVRQLATTARRSGANATESPSARRDPPHPMGPSAENLWGTRDRLRQLRHRRADLSRVARGMVIAVVGSALILAGTATTSTPVAIAVGLGGLSIIALWTARARRRWLGASRLLGQQLPALGPDGHSRPGWLIEWTQQWDAALADESSTDEDRQLLTTLLQLEAAGIVAANDLEVTHVRWETAIAGREVPPVPLHRAESVITTVGSGPLEPVVVAGPTIRGVDAQRVRELLQRPTRRSVWVVAPEADAWASGRPS